MAAMADDPRVARLSEIGRRMRRMRRECDRLEGERDNLLRELATEQGRGAASELARLTGLTRGRVHQIVKVEQDEASDDDA